MVGLPFFEVLEHIRKGTGRLQERLALLSSAEPMRSSGPVSYTHLEKDVIEKHGIRILPDVPRNFEGIRDYLEKHNIEGIVFWKDGQPQCKIKRSDFGFPWGE